MSFYQLNFATLVAANAVLAYRQYRQAIWQEITPKTTPDIEKSARKGEIDQFTKDFFVVYLLVVAADWLQVSITIAPEAFTRITNKVAGPSYICAVPI